MGLKRLVILTVLMGAFAVPALACLWDRDTIETELQGVPDRRTLVSNRWYRHGAAYYQERINRLGTEDSLTLAECDDLAVAYERLQEYESALTTLDRKLALLEETPNKEHLYRYHANYGTVLAHSGDYQAALEHLEKAIAIEPEAHFGREEFQIILIRFVIEAQKDPSLWDKHNYLTHSRSQPTEEDLEKAFQGTAGMLRFGGREGPELYRAMGDISHAQGHLNIAWYCYHFALLKNHPASELIREKIGEIEEHWETGDPRLLPNEQHFEKVHKNSREWLEAFHKAELSVLSENKDPGDEEILSSLIEEANREVPPIELAAPTLNRAASLELINSEPSLQSRMMEFAPLVFLLVTSGGFVGWLAWSYRKERRKEH